MTYLSEESGLGEVRPCPKCNERDYEEVLVNVTVTSLILEVFPEGDMEYEAVENHGGWVDRYQCFNCGYQVVDDETGATVEDAESFREWLMRGNSDG